MLRKVFRTGNSMVVSLPRETLEYLNIHEGTEVEVDLDRENRQVIISKSGTSHAPIKSENKPTTKRGASRHHADGG